MGDKINVTLSVNKKIYDKYQKIMADKGMIASRQFEIMMEKQIKGDA